MKEVINKVLNLIGAYNNSGILPVAKDNIVKFELNDTNFLGNKSYFEVICNDDEFDITCSLGLEVFKREHIDFDLLKSLISTIFVIFENKDKYELQEDGNFLEYETSIYDDIDFIVEEVVNTIKYLNIKTDPLLDKDKLIINHFTINLANEIVGYELQNPYKQQQMIDYFLIKCNENNLKIKKIS